MFCIVWEKMFHSHYLTRSFGTKLFHLIKKGKNLYQVAYIKFVQFTYKILPLVQFFHVNKEVFVVSQYSIQKPNNKENNYET